MRERDRAHAYAQHRCVIRLVFCQSTIRSYSTNYLRNVENCWALKNVLIHIMCTLTQTRLYGLYIFFAHSIAILFAYYIKQNTRNDTTTEHTFTHLLIHSLFRHLTHTRCRKVEVHLNPCLKRARFVCVCVHSMVAW